MSERATKGLVHIYTGDGKGKTTAALGVALRALGWGMKVSMIQFIKGYPKIGELMAAERFPGEFEVRQFAIDITRNIEEEKILQRRALAEKAMVYSESVVKDGKFDIVILDEINNALHYGLIDVPRVIALINNKPPHQELILTGRSAPQEIIDVADYVTEMMLIRHPYEEGIQARPGIDY